MRKCPIHDLELVRDSGTAGGKVYTFLRCPFRTLNPVGIIAHCTFARSIKNLNHYGRNANRKTSRVNRKQKSS
jgi:hypothetical protein